MKELQSTGIACSVNEPSPRWRLLFTRAYIAAWRTGNKKETYRAPIGEWGGHRLPVSAHPILVHVVAGGIHWSDLTEHDGKRYFSAAAFKRDTIGGVAVASLAPDSNGEVPLDALVAQVRAPR